MEYQIARWRKCGDGKFVVVVAKPHGGEAVHTGEANYLTKLLKERYNLNIVLLK